MRIVCPGCKATYEVPPALLTSGRKLRCAKCANDFQPNPVESPPEAAPRLTRQPEPSPQALVRPGREQTRPLSRRQRTVARAVAAGWAASLLVLVGLGWASLAWRMPIMHAWPPSTRLYAALGYA